MILMCKNCNKELSEMGLAYYGGKCPKCGNVEFKEEISSSEQISDQQLGLGIQVESNKKHYV